MRIERKGPGDGEPVQAPAPPVKRGGLRKYVILTVLSLLLIAGGVYGFRTYRFYAHHVTTDDAQVEGHIDPVLPRVSGYVAEVLVKENQQVKAGDVLLRIDTADLQAKVDQEQAALANAQAAVSVAQAAVSSAQAAVVRARADVAAAGTRQRQMSADLERYQKLWDKEEVSHQQYDAARAAADAARSSSDASRATVASASAQVEAAERQVAAAQAQVAQHQAALQAAMLQLSYATITSPVSGVVSKKDVEVGQMVQAGQPLLAIVQGHDAWVVANFKETQLEGMRPGQPVEVEVDAYPGVKFHAKVESLAAATGAKFSLLPPDNATGNFTKVVQRVPVKIVFTDPPNPQRPLRVGMNVAVVVDLG
jgi:membrane fusion protein (multidrug efflux system)